METLLDEQHGGLTMPLVVDQVNALSRGSKVMVACTNRGWLDLRFDLLKPTTMLVGAVLLLLETEVRVR